MNLPKTGDIIVFTKVPGMSYADTGTPYLIEVQRGTIYLKDIKTGSGAFDQARQWKFAEWHYA